MQPTAQAVLLSWSIPPAATFALVVTAAIYLRGWWLMRWARVPFVPAWRAACFLLGLLSLWVALASPLDTFSGFLLTAHMLQHMVLMMVAPPLILLGAPLIPLVRGLPIFAAREFAGPFLNSRWATRAGNALIHPAVALILMGAAMFAWHTPRLYDLALTSGAWHEFEHACFFLASLIFWWPVIQPWPSKPLRPRWMVVPYLLIGDLQNTILSGILVFSDRVIYPTYTKIPRLFGFSALADQVASGAIMWVMGSVVFLIPACIIAVQCMSSRRTVASVPCASEGSPALDAIVSAGQRLPSSTSLLRRWVSPAAAEAITFVSLFLAVGVCAATLASGGSEDDDQVMRSSQGSGPFVISVWSLPGDLAIGDAEFSVLVQDRDRLEVLQDATIELRAAKSGAEEPGEAVRASNADAENKLLQSAEVELPSAGEWTLNVHVSHGDQSGAVSLPLRVAKAEGGIDAPWPWVALAVFSAVLLVSYWRRCRAERNVVKYQTHVGVG